MAEQNKLYESIENRLDSALSPVDLEDTYIDRLHSRLLSEPGITLERDNYIKLLIFILFSLVTGISLVLLINRIFSREEKSHSA